MFKRFRAVFVVTLMFAVMCLSACGAESEKKKFVGTWVTTGKFSENVTVTFNDDGTMKWVRHYQALGDAVTTGRYEPDAKNTYLTIYPDKDPNDTIGASENEWGFKYVITKDYMTFYKEYSNEAVYSFKKQS